MNKLYLRNSNGQPSASLTMALVSFVLVTAWLVFWVVGTTFGLHVPAFDSTAAMGYMTPLLGLYFGRRWTDKDAIPASQSGQEDSDEDSETPPEEEEETVEEEQQPANTTTETEAAPTTETAAATTAKPSKRKNRPS